MRGEEKEKGLIWWEEGEGEEEREGEEVEEEGAFLSCFLMGGDVGERGGGGVLRMRIMRDRLTRVFLSSSSGEEQN